MEGFNALKSDQISKKIELVDSSDHFQTIPGRKVRKCRMLLRNKFNASKRFDQIFAVEVRFF